MEMKKILIILLMSLLCCSAAACGKKENKDTKPSTNTENRTDVEERMAVSYTHLEKTKKCDVSVCGKS